MNQPSIEPLLDAIYAAFPVGVPPARPITGHRCYECDETDRLLGGRTWIDVAANFPQSCHDTFPLLTLAAQTYYLPAFLCFALRSPGYMASVSAQCALERGYPDSKSFTREQRLAVWAWAEWHYGQSLAQFPPDSVAEDWWLSEG